MTVERRVISIFVPIALSGLLTGCGDDPRPPAAPSTTATPATSATPPPPTPAPTTLATPTPTPAPSCSVSISDARFEPARLLCPAGTSNQTIRLVFEVSAGNALPVTINRVSTSGVTCRISRGTCTWPEGSLSVSPSLVPAGSTVQIAATQSFSCSSVGNSDAPGELIIARLFVNTSCGAAREIRVTNTLALG